MEEERAIVREDLCNGCIGIIVHLTIGKLRHASLGDAPVRFREGNACASERVGGKDCGRGETSGQMMSCALARDREDS